MFYKMTLHNLTGKEVEMIQANLSKIEKTLILPEVIVEAEEN